MANPDYFYNASNARPYYDYEQNSPLRPLPSPYTPSPYESPSRSYSGVGLDPYDDHDAIPLHNGKEQNFSQSTLKPMLPHEEDNPFIREIDHEEQERKRRRRLQTNEGWFRGRITWVVFTLTIIQLVVFVVEIAKNGILTGSPIEIHPTFNPMIGPSPYVLINVGARYQPCMHNMPNVQNATTRIQWPCPNATATTGSDVSCTLSELCGLGGVPNPHPGGSLEATPAPNQWFRFIIPIFIHAGLIHIGFNLLLQLTLGRDIEKLIGSLRFAIVYFASGIFGFVLGGNFAANGIASCGCSGSLFGILAITLLDLLYTWKQRTSPIRDLLFICVDVIIAFVLGLLPGLDNFSHIGGFLMGLVLGICLLRSPAAIARRTTTTATSTSHERDGLQSFVHQPFLLFQGRRGVWWLWWLVRVGALVGVLVCFVLLIKNFYVWGVTCSWCKYLSCLPVTVNGVNWCTEGILDFTPTNSSAKRDLGGLVFGGGGGRVGGFDSMMGRS